MIQSVLFAKCHGIDWNELQIGQTTILTPRMMCFSRGFGSMQTWDHCRVALQMSHLCPTYVPPMSHLCPTYVPHMSHICPTSLRLGKPVRNAVHHKKIRRKPLISTCSQQLKLRLQCHEFSCSSFSFLISVTIQNTLSYFITKYHQLIYIRRRHVVM